MAEIYCKSVVQNTQALLAHELLAWSLNFSVYGKQVIFNAIYNYYYYDPQVALLLLRQCGDFFKLVHL